MKKYLLMFTLMMFSALSQAHEGHGMGDNVWHSVFHLLFWALVVAVAWKGCHYLKSRATGRLFK